MLPILCFVQYLHLPPSQIDPMYLYIEVDPMNTTTTATLTNPPFLILSHYPNFPRAATRPPPALGHFHRLRPRPPFPLRHSKLPPPLHLNPLPTPLVAIPIHFTGAAAIFDLYFLVLPFTPPFPIAHHFSSATSPAAISTIHSSPNLTSHLRRI